MNLILEIYDKINNEYNKLLCNENEFTVVNSIRIYNTIYCKNTKNNNYISIY